MDLQHVTSFVAGETGPWEGISSKAISGPPLETFKRLDIILGKKPESLPVWILNGLSSNIRYTSKDEIEKLKAIQPGLGRYEATYAAMIPLKKSDDWWNLAQDERRAIMEEQSAHIKEGMNFLPAIARKLYHSKDLGEPFDFVTWFEFSPANEGKFNDLLAFLRASAEWKYVTREIDIRLVKSQ